MNLDLQTGVVFLIGAIWGSFLNVCIYRLPRKESVVWPGSHCPRCQTPLPLWCNIPVLSYLLLRGKCLFCGAKIPLRYPMVEILTAALLTLLWQLFGFGFVFIQNAILTLLLIIITFIDLDYKLILNKLTFPGMVAGLIFSLIFHLITPVSALTGLLVGGGFLWLIGLLGNYAFKKESMGGGDIKLAAMIGAFLGPKVIIALFLSFFLSLPVIAIGLSSGRLKMGATVPFGPFISLATLVFICFGENLIHLYYRFLGF